MIGNGAVFVKHRAALHLDGCQIALGRALPDWGTPILGYLDFS